MAIVKCPYCSSDYSEYADKCPECGLSIEEAIQKALDDGRDIIEYDEVNDNSSYNVKNVWLLFLMLLLILMLSVFIL